MHRIQLARKESYQLIILARVLMGVHLGTLQAGLVRLPFNGLGVDASPFELVPVPVVLGACARNLVRVAVVLLLPAVPAASQNTKSTYIRSEKRVLLH